MMNMARPSGLTPWRMVRTQSTSLYFAVAPPGVMLGARSLRLPSGVSTNTEPMPLVAWQSPQPRDANRYLPRASVASSATTLTPLTSTATTRSRLRSYITLAATTSPSPTTISTATPPPIHFNNFFIPPPKIEARSVPHTKPLLIRNCLDDNQRRGKHWCCWLTATLTNFHHQERDRTRGRGVDNAGAVQCCRQPRRQRPRRHASRADQAGADRKGRPLNPLAR